MRSPGSALVTAYRGGSAALPASLATPQGRARPSSVRKLVPCGCSATHPEPAEEEAPKRSHNYSRPSPDTWRTRALWRFVTMRACWHHPVTLEPFPGQGSSTLQSEYSAVFLLGDWSYSLAKLSSHLTRRQRDGGKLAVLSP